MSQYSQDFYDELDEGVTRSAARVVPLILDMVTPQSVFDFGCGRGQWLSAFKAAGVSEVHGLDGPWVEPTQLVISASEFTSADFANGDRPELPRQRYDLATSFEVLEHLDEPSGTEAVALLSRLSDLLIVSAAIPSQGGTGHINERWPDYWYPQFKALGFECFDCIRHQVWNEDAVEWWYAQNILVYARGPAQEPVSAYSNSVGGMAGPPRSLVHPGLYAAKLSEIANCEAAAAAAKGNSPLRRLARKVKRAFATGAQM
jgi:SAM-dependent methyltransferase